MDAARSRLLRFFLLTALVVALPGCAAGSDPARPAASVSAVTSSGRPTSASPSPLETTPAPSPGDAPALTPDGTRPLVGTTWVAEHLNEPVTGIELNGRPWLRFAPDGTLGGFDGCNRIGGRYSVAGEKITVAAEVFTRRNCLVNRAPGLPEALKTVDTFTLHPSGLSLSEVDGRTRVGLHALTVTDEDAPFRVWLRISNNTGKTITSVSVRSSAGVEHYGAIAPGASSDYRTPIGALYRYASYEVTFADGTTRQAMAADFVGEVPLAPGRYTYVLSLPSKAQQDEAIVPLVNLGLEESGRPSLG